MYMLSLGTMIQSPAKIGSSRIEVHKHKLNNFTDR